MVSYQDVPLRDVLQRMLRDETYMIGVRAGEQPTDVEVSWLHVTASKAGTLPAGAVAVPPPLAAAPPNPGQPKVPGSMAGFGVAPKVIAQALGSQDAAERRAATRELAEYLEANPEKMDAFVSDVTAATVEDLAGYPHAIETLRTLAIREKNPDLRAKIDAMVKSVSVHGGVPPKPAFPSMQQGMPH